MTIPQFILDAMKSGTGVSEKRISRMVIVNILLVLTIIDFFANKCVIRWEIFSTWLGFAGYDGYRISAEKKYETKVQTTVSAGGDSVEKKSEVISGK